MDGTERRLSRLGVAEVATGVRAVGSDFRADIFSDFRFRFAQWPRPVFSFSTTPFSLFGRRGALRAGHGVRQPRPGPAGRADRGRQCASARGPSGRRGSAGRLFSPWALRTRAGRRGNFSTRNHRFNARVVPDDDWLRSSHGARFCSSVPRGRQI